MTTIPPEASKAMVGQDVGVSKWFTIDQNMIDTFADVTFDHQYIHVDPARAAASPFGGTIAHGFLTLSLLPAMAADAVPAMEGVTMGVNYGFDKLRFISPVRVNSRVRGRFVLAEYKDIRPGEVQTKLEVTVETEGQDKPALAGLWLARRYFGDTAD
ncbi:MaoC family dehydratase [Thalassovita taeanensis]|uniref:Acyl dehydratase n=1 Tax=Thalassovita taeanensis TaxID=657014 RepID=A0A1H9B6V2_9RHOB|nr:MaoC family dehydratase [Thalassovita taeanensis]SEP84756.1 Acyl dehydratase [Thalassovita taeanensis]